MKSLFDILSSQFYPSLLVFYVRITKAFARWLNAYPLIPKFRLKPNSYVRYFVLPYIVAFDLKA